MFPIFNVNPSVARLPRILSNLSSLIIVLLLLTVSSCKKGKSGSGDTPEPDSTTDATFLQVATSENNTMAIDTKNVLWVTGDNRGAVLGLGNKNKYTSFVRALDQVKGVSISDSRSMMSSARSSTSANHMDWSE